MDNLISGVLLFEVGNSALLGVGNSVLNLLWSSNITELSTGFLINIVDATARFDDSSLDGESLLSDWFNEVLLSNLNSVDLGDLDDLSSLLADELTLSGEGLEVLTDSLVVDDSVFVTEELWLFEFSSANS